MSLKIICFNTTECGNGIDVHLVRVILMKIDKNNLIIKSKYKLTVLKQP